MRDLAHSIQVKRVLSPVATPADNTAQVGQIIDRLGYDSLTYLIATGAIPDVDATFTVLLEESDVLGHGRRSRRCRRRHDQPDLGHGARGCGCVPVRRRQPGSQARVYRQQALYAVDYHARSNASATLIAAVAVLAIRSSRLWCRPPPDNPRLAASARRAFFRVRLPDADRRHACRIVRSDHRSKQ